jgi:hypothetical protein
MCLPWLGLQNPTTWLPWRKHGMRLRLRLAAIPNAAYRERGMIVRGRLALSVIADGWTST